MIQFAPYLCFRSLLSALCILAFGIFFGIMCCFSFTRRILLKHPKSFSLGLFTEEGPDRNQLLTERFSITFVGRGWTNASIGQPLEEHASPPNTEIVTQIEGPGKSTYLPYFSADRFVYTVCWRAVYWALFLWMLL
ncbi:unnamed protein product [Protopolystoma xenopodis]|uniref:Uncharacterized protein n=1 Tax=Protopolystoma xenopodis TaxID=117903 RepID=A0A3S5BPN7_9PLAT|nr:unnamed protein product [Protopolystoma xenopodis]